MEVGHAITKRFEVQLSGVKGVIDGCSHFGHFFEVEPTKALIKIEDLSDTPLGDEEHAPLEVLVGCKPDIAGLEPSDEARIAALVGRSVVGTDGAVLHELSMPTGSSSVPTAGTVTHLGTLGGGSVTRTRCVVAFDDVGMDEMHGLGYERVDDDPNVDVLFDTMDATGTWNATRRLRTWERDQLRLDLGKRLLDVGCGLGDAALALAQQLGDDGEVVGVDASTEMVTIARKRARTTSCRARFSVGDALALDEKDGYFDVARSERTLQWLTDPLTAVRELARVLRSNGVVSLIDTDWSTFVIDVGDVALTARVREAMKTERGRPSNIGGRLPELVRSAGFEVLAETAATQTWNGWNPDESPAPHGCFSMSSLADDLVDAGQLQPGERQRFVSTIHEAARDGRFSMALTMFGVVARAPATID